MAATTTSVASGTSSVQLTDGSVRGVTITNTDANTLYVLLGSGTASSTNYTVALATGDYYEVPEHYDGAVQGVWSADGTGAAIVTEF
jgi:hypothetical protein